MATLSANIDTQNSVLSADSATLSAKYALNNSHKPHK